MLDLQNSGGRKANWILQREERKKSYFCLFFSGVFRSCVSDFLCAVVGGDVGERRRESQVEKKKKKEKLTFELLN